MRQLRWIIARWYMIILVATIIIIDIILILIGDVVVVFLHISIILVTTIIHLIIIVGLMFGDVQFYIKIPLPISIQFLLIFSMFFMCVFKKCYSILENDINSMS